MFHYEHVLFPQVAERAPARLVLRKGVALHPPPTGILVEVSAWVHGPIQASHDRTGHGDARLAEAEPRVPCRTKNTFSSFQRQQRVIWWIVLSIRIIEPSGNVYFFHST